jgi:hypothetical protein
MRTPRSGYSRIRVLLRFPKSDGSPARPGDVLVVQDRYADALLKRGVVELVERILITTGMESESVENKAFEPPENKNRKKRK